MGDDPTAPARAKQLLGWVETMSERVLSAGTSCALGGDGRWFELLAELGVTPLPEGERERHLREGSKRARGALPIEVRWAIESVEKRARGWLWEIDKSMPTEYGDAYVRPIEQKLHGMVERTVRAHLAATAGAVVTTSSIFANARNTTPSYAQMGKKAGLEEVSCRTCGAPRARAGDLGRCTYCGGELA
jgi:hypothetical protein